MNRAKFILSYIFGFIASTLISILVILLIGKFTILNIKYVESVLVKNNYYKEVYKGAYEEIENYMVSSGLEDVVLDKIFSEKDIKRDVNNYLEALYRGESYKVDTSFLNKKLSENIDNYLVSNNLDVEDRNELDLFISDVCNIYKKEVTFYGSFKLLNKYINFGIDNINGLIILVSELSIICILTILILGNNIISSSIMSSGLILLFIRVMIYEKVDIKNIMIISNYFSESLKYILNRIGYDLLASSILLIVIGLIISIIEFVGKRKFKLEKGVVLNGRD